MKLRGADELKTIGQYLENPEMLKSLIESAKKGDNKIHTATLRNLCDYVADNTEEYRRPFLMNIASIADTSVAVRVLMNPELLERVTIYDRKITGEHTNDSFEFFMAEDKELPGIKSIDARKVPFYFCPTHLSLLSATYTPAGGVNLQSLSEAARKEIIKTADYGLIADAVALNGELNLAFGKKAYIERQRMRKLGDSYRTDKDHGELFIDRHDIVSLGAEIEAEIKVEKLMLPENRILELAITGIRVRP